MLMFITALDFIFQEKTCNQHYSNKKQKYASFSLQLRTNKLCVLKTNFPIIKI